MPANSVVIGVGSNLQNPIEQLRTALSLLKKIPHVHVQKVSSIYESDAQLPKDAPSTWDQKFLNAAVLIEVENSVEPQRLLQRLKDIELGMGRDNNQVWAPRIIDLDILYWHGLKLELPALNVPHLGLSSRPFALLPLLEVFPDAEVQKPFWTSRWIEEKPFSTKISKYCWPKIMGIVNLTTDSFSDGDRDRNLEKIEELAPLVDILDLGAESTRPGAPGIDLGKEWEFLSEALEIACQFDVEISIDSYKPVVQAKCIENFDVDYINDVTGLADPEMVKVARQSRKKVFIMHSLSVPPIASETLPLDQSPVELLSGWWSDKKANLLEAGLQTGQMIFDPGIGFGKTKLQCMFILENLAQFSEIKEDILIGHSRKSFLTLLSNREAKDRDFETGLVTRKLNQAFVQYLRVHDPISQMIALRAGL